MSSIVYSVIDCSKLIEELVAMLESCIEREKEFQSLSSEYFIRVKELMDSIQNILSGKYSLQRETRHTEEYVTNFNYTLPVSPLIAPKLDDEYALEAALLLTELTGIFHFAAKVIGDNHLGYIPGTYWIYCSDSCTSLHPFMEIVDVEQTG